MDTRNTVAITVGLGALGTLLAYYGYNNLNNDSIKKEETEVGKESQIATTEEQRKLAATRPKSLANETVEENVKLAIAEIRKEKQKVQNEEEVGSVSVLQEIIDNDTSNAKKEMEDSAIWKQYWKNEYNATNQPDASDYN